ncbi:MAG: CCA tRNA nucleotidyltransferase [Lachnospiraceae bacterium]|nr:CCA tRNA nucleotidyltransferase [Lachnospiraceae bacterium]
MVILPEKVKYIIDTLERHGFEAYAVGGCVRDSILGREPMDWDITTSALPEEVKKLFKRTIDTGIQHGTVTIMMDKEGFEVTTYRLDGDYDDGRHPKEVTFTSSITEDLKRRDFTINAMAYNDREGLVDKFDGRGDLERKVIRCVGDPKERFSEDALRMMRAVRFAAQLGFSIDEETKNAIGLMSNTLSKVSAERIQVELSKLIASSHPEEMRTLYETGLTKVMLPEFDELMCTEQNTPHHSYTVGEHTIIAMCNIRADLKLRLTMLLHDIAKPDKKTTDKNGRDHFYGHPEAGETKAKQILRRLKYDNDTIKYVCRLIRYHDYKPEINPISVRRTISEIGEEYYPDIFEVYTADRMAQSLYKREEKLAYIEKYRQLYQKIINDGDCLIIKDLAINGKDLMALGIPQGAGIGEMLAKCLDAVLDNPKMNTRDELLSFVKNSLKEG